MDKVCADSVKEFQKVCAESMDFATLDAIAKLDSNGVQVLPEGQRGKTTSPQVSSTDFSLPVDGKYLSIFLSIDWFGVCVSVMYIHLKIKIDYLLQLINYRIRMIQMKIGALFVQMVAN